MIFNPKSIDFLKELTLQLIRETTVNPGERLGDCVSEFAGPVLNPSGTGGYPAFWTRDPIMACSCGLIPAATEESMFQVLASGQAAEDFRTASGAFVPKGSITDHINANRAAIYFPGTYDDKTQGGEPWGTLPPFDDPFYFILLGGRIFRRRGKAFLQENFGGLTAAERMLRAFYSVPHDRESGLVECTKNLRGVSFGFYDSIPFTGRLLFASLLRRAAARELVFMGIYPASEAAPEKMSAEIEKTFRGPSGLLHAATEVNNRPDVWASLYAVYTDAVSVECARRIADVLRSEWKNGSLCRSFAVTHIFNGDYWETPCCKAGEYQNGAFWYTPSGWMLHALTLVSERDADDFFEGLCETYQEGLKRGEPVPDECFNPDIGWNTPNQRYLTSAALPLAAVLRNMRTPGVSEW